MHCSIAFPKPARLLEPTLLRQLDRTMDALELRPNSRISALDLELMVLRYLDSKSHSVFASICWISVLRFMEVSYAREF